MKMRASIGRIAAVVLVLALVGGGAYLFMTQPAKAPAAPQAPPPPQVGVVELKAADVPLPLEFSGRVAGFRVVEIRAQVSGILLKREYLEGAVVDVGQVLFRIDPADLRGHAGPRQRAGGAGQGGADPGRGEL